MKKKAILFTSAICGILAVVLFVVGMGLLDWNFTALDSESWESGSRELNEPPTSIEIACHDAFLQIKAGEQLGVEYEESNRRKVTIEEADGKLKIKQSYENGGIFRMFTFHTPTMTLTVPKELSELKISVTNGSIDISGLESERLNITCTNATVELSDMVLSGDTELRSTNGVVTLDKITTLGAIKLVTTNGKIELNDIKAKTAEVGSTNGLLELENIECDALTLKTVNGKIDAAGVSANAITATSTNGKIVLELSGRREDYTVECSSVNGRTPGNSFGGEKTVACTTVNGNIEISYKA